MKLDRACPFCGTPMLIHHTNVHHSLWSTDTGVGIYARDEWMKCPKCKFFCVFGVPITKDEYEATFEKQKGALDVMSMDKKQMMKRLTELGYLDCDK